MDGLPAWVQWTLFVVQVGTLVALVLYVVFTKDMAEATVKSARASHAAVDEMKANRRAEVRPFVSVYFDVFGGLPELVIANTGRSPAINVRLALDHPMFHNQGQNLGDSLFMSRGIPVLHPGGQVRVLVEIPRAKIGEGSDEVVWNATLTYSDSWEEEELVEQYALDMAMYKDIRWINTKGVHDAAKSLDEIRRSLDAIAHEMKSRRAVRPPQPTEQSRQ